MILPANLLGFQWTSIDTWMLVTAVLASTACAIPGCYLFLRKQSMIADALTHSAFPGVVGAFVVAGIFESNGWISHEGGWAVRQSFMFVGSMITGLLTAVLTEWVTRNGWVRGDAALGIVFTTLFAIGLIMMRVFSDNSHIEVDCVLYGQLETIGLRGSIPREAIVCLVMLIFNVIGVVALFKELAITTFDPQLAEALGFRPRVMHYGLLTVTTATLVTAFEVVGSILVIGMLVTPAATAFFVTRRLQPMLIVAAVTAVLSCLIGILAANTVPGPLTSALGLPYTDSVIASGAITIASAAILILAMLFGPERGILLDRFRVDRADRENTADRGSIRTANADG